MHRKLELLKMPKYSISDYYCRPQVICLKSTGWDSSPAPQKLFLFAFGKHDRYFSDQSVSAPVDGKYRSAIVPMVFVSFFVLVPMNSINFNNLQIWEIKWHWVSLNFNVRFSRILNFVRSYNVWRSLICFYLYIWKKFLSRLLFLFVCFFTPLKGRCTWVAKESDSNLGTSFSSLNGL